MDELRHLHKVLLIIMDEFDRVCKKQGIRYTLTGGSLLGAVRHGGFIPWDDDMDVALTRANYEKLIACKHDFKSDFFLQTNISDKKYNYGYAKLLLKGTTAIEYGHEVSEYRKGIFLDIFPLDNVPDKQGSRIMHKNKNYFLQKLLRQKSQIRDDPSWSLRTKLLFQMLDLISLASNREGLIDRLNHNMTRFGGEETKQLTNLCGMYGYEKECVPADWFNSYKAMPFEDRQYVVIEKCTDYLQHIYGNYMELPPAEQRRSHSYVKLDFGKY